MRERDDLEIELAPSGQPASGETAEARPAPDATAVGEPAGYPVVVIDGPVRQWIEEYSRSDTSRERGGVLLGSVDGPDEQAHVTIVAAIEAVGAEERAASITFTHETWEHINSVKDERYPDLRIVGWFHTHPGYGIFLSGYDLFIHRNFFTPLWQVAYVIDPVHNDRGFFGWREGDVARLPGYHVRGEMPAGPQLLPPIEIVDARPARWRPVLVWASLCIALLSLATAGWFGYSLHRLQGRYRALATQLQRAQDDRRAVQTYAEALRGQLAGALHRPPAPPQEIRVPLARGDTLWGLSERYLGDPFRFGELQDYNRISDPKRLPAGSSLAIPFDPASPKASGPPSGRDPRATRQTGKEK